MIFFIILFPVIGFLISALVLADQQAAEAVETARVREWEQP